MSHVHRIEFPFTGRYHVLGNAGPRVKELLYVLHGHGQLSQYFIRKFSGIETPERIIVAPEGLSRYYLQGYTGRVGATWMTREDREADIHNYVNYLNHLHSALSPLLSENVKISVLGFSQGAATATRWLMDGKVNADRLILWAGILPYDMDIRYARERLGSMEKIYVYGNADPFVNSERKEEMQHLMDKGGLEFLELTFDGAHDMDTRLLGQLFPLT